MSAYSEKGVAAGMSLQGVRIARISTVPYAVVIQLGQQIESLVASGAHVLVVASDGPELAAFNTQSGINCVPVDIARSIAPWRDLRALILLWKLFRKEGIEIAHSTTPKAGLLTAIAGFLAGVPLRLHTFTGQPWVGMRGIKRWLARSSDWLIGRLNTKCYADSESQRQFLIDQGIVEAQKLAVIGTGSLAGVDTRRFAMERFTDEERKALLRTLGIAPDAPVLLFVGRITTDKGVRELLKAFAGLKAEGSRAHLVFVGPFDMDSGAGGSVSPHEIMAIRDTHFAGFSENPERYMSIADILCLPSYREGFGTVVIEAAAMGVPAVGTNIYGLKDAIEDGKTGILVAPKNIESLRAALQVLLSNEEVRSSMGIAAKRRTIELFDADRVNAGVIEEYRLLHNRSLP